MKIYTTVNEVYVNGKGWVKPEADGSYDANNTARINYNYIEVIIAPDKNIITETGQEDVPIEFSRECLYADGCRIHESAFFMK